MLEWTDLGRDGDGDGDQNADLPGGSWAEIGKDARLGWSWTILEHRDEEPREIAWGSGPDEATVKATVERWEATRHAG